MKYRIGELAKIFSITKEGIRYYEKANILKPVRNEENGYRYYDELDFQKLGAIRKLQNINFTLDEIKNIYYKENKAGILYTYKKKLDEIKSEIYIKNKIKENLDRQIQIIDNVDKLTREYKEIDCGDYYRLNFKTINDIIYSKNITVVSTWFKNMFIVNASSKIIASENVIDIIGKGLIIEKEIGDRLLSDIDIPEELEFINNKLCFYTIIKITNGEYELEVVKNMIADYKAKTGNELGEGFTRVVFSYVNEAGIAIVYSELYLSILEK